MIKIFASNLFKIPFPEDIDQISICDAVEKLGDDINDTPSQENQYNSGLILQLSKMCFLVGHVAVKSIVHIESIESEWKRRKYLGNFQHISKY